MSTQVLPPLDITKVFGGGLNPPPQPATEVSSLDAVLSTFKPNFNDPMYFQQGIFVVGFGTMSRINPARCVTDYTAALLAFVFADLNPRIVQGPPIGTYTSQFGGGWSMSQTVPWFVFPDGTAINVADVAGYFCHGYPISAALANARWEITQDVAATAAAKG